MIIKFESYLKPHKCVLEVIVIFFFFYYFIYLILHSRDGWFHKKKYFFSVSFSHRETASKLSTKIKSFGFVLSLLSGHNQRNIVEKGFQIL